jgi:hypothetical protein
MRTKFHARPEQGGRVYVNVSCDGAHAGSFIVPSDEWLRIEAVLKRANPQRSRRAAPADAAPAEPSGVTA